MKRFTVIALALVMSFSMLTACSSTEEDVTVGTVTEEPPDTDGNDGGNDGGDDGGDNDGDSLEKEPENTYPPTEEKEN